MSNRGDFVGSAPESGIYQPRPTPATGDEMPVYINDELLSLGGRVNNILEGGAFPPQSQLPKRVKEGMMIYFTKPVNNSKGELVINAPGIWLYQKNKWWKIISDPTAVTQTLQVYQILPKGSSVPAAPELNKYLEEDIYPWSYTPGTSSTDLEQWMSIAPRAFLADPVDVKWQEPIIFNAQGDAGQPGLDGYTAEFRYIASTDEPEIINPTGRVPETASGETFTKEYPETSHPDKSYLWVTSGLVRENALRGEWANPTRYSTPDTTEVRVAFGLSKEDDNMPAFDPDSSGLPGLSWTSAQPEIPSGWVLWRTERLVWTDGTPQGRWAFPYKVNSTEGQRSERRYIASTTVPKVDDPTRRLPESFGEPYFLQIPETTPPLKNYVWSIEATIDRFNELVGVWTDPAKVFSPETSEYVHAYVIGSKQTYPAFDASASGLPGDAWVSDQPFVSKGEYLWDSFRRQWLDGTRADDWSRPTRITPADGLSQETRYAASTEIPAIATMDREPAGWELNYPTTSHPDHSFVWASTATILTTDDSLHTFWSTPEKVATPDSSRNIEKFAIGTDTTYPGFNPNVDNPGDAWLSEMPSPTKAQRVWRTSRIEWTDGTGITVWSNPSLISGSNGIDGATGNDGLTLVEVFRNAATPPPQVPDAERNYPPADWSKEQTTPARFEHTYVMKSYAIGLEATSVLYPYSMVAQLSGTDGTDGNDGAEGKPGLDAIQYYTWIMFADNASGLNISPNPAGKKYVGFAYQKTIETPSTNPSDYKWAKTEGDQGIPGTPGTDGATLYTWVKYADTSTGEGMSDSSDGKEYLGLAYNKTTSAESTDPTQYTWSLIKGTDGTNGTDGKDGIDGAPGINGNDGADGSPGAGFYSLPWTSFDGTWPPQATVDSAFRSAFGRDSERDDVLTIYNETDVTIAKTRRKLSTGAWAEAAFFMHGDMLVRGTITGDRIVAGTEITAPVVKGGRIEGTDIIGTNITGTSNITGANINGGTLNIGSNFKVSNSGVLTAKGANVNGDITALNLSAENVSSLNMTSTGTISGGKIVGAEIENAGGTFRVTAGGKLTAKDAEITGDVVATTLEAQSVTSINMTSTGTISGGTVTGTHLTGGDIRVPATGDAQFTVDPHGNMVCKNATIKGKIESGSQVFGHIKAESLELLGSIPPEIDNNNIDTGMSGNVIVDAGFVNAFSGGVPLGWTKNSGLPATFTYRPASDYWGLNHKGVTGEINQGNPVGSASNTASVYTPWTSVTRGQRVFGSVYVASHRCISDMYIDIYNNAGAWVTNSTVQVCDECASGGSELSGYKRLTVFVDVPANGAQARLVIRKRDTTSGYTSSYLFYVLPQLTVVKPGQTDIPEWINGPYLTPDQIGAATTGQVNSAQTSADNANSGVSTINGKLYLDMTQTHLKSSNFSSGSAGWAINRAGSAEFNNVIVRGTIHAKDLYLTNATVHGTLSAANIRGDITDVLPKWRGAHSGTYPYKTTLEIYRVTVVNAEPFERKLYINYAQCSAAVGRSKPQFQGEFFYSSPWSGEVRISTGFAREGVSWNPSYEGVVTVPANRSGAVVFYIRGIGDTRYDGVQLSYSGLTVQNFLFKKSDAMY